MYMPFWLKPYCTSSPCSILVGIWHGCAPSLSTGEAPVRRTGGLHMAGINLYSKYLQGARWRLFE